MYKRYSLTVQIKIFGIIKTFIRKRPGVLVEKERYSFVAKNDKEAEQKAQEIVDRNKKRIKAEIATLSEKGVFLWNDLEAEIHECFFVEVEKINMFQTHDFSEESVKTALENLTIEQFKEMYGANCLEAICEQ